MTSQKNFCRASDLIGLREQVDDEFGFQGKWVAYHFDAAVTELGNYIEAKLMEPQPKKGRKRSDKERLIALLDYAGAVKRETTKIDTSQLHFDGKVVAS